MVQVEFLIVNHEIKERKIVMKKIVSLILSLAICLSLVPSTFAAETRNTPAKFTDVPADAWYWVELDYALYNGYISGTSATTFDPSGKVTRGQFVTILGRMMGVQASQYTSSKFVDVDMKSWYGPYVAWAASQGYVNGVSSTRFEPGWTITIEQMGKILDNYLLKSGKVLTDNPVIYTDAASISVWAKSSMDTMAQFDLIPTDASGKVRPQAAVTRAEAAVSLVRMAKGIGLGTEPPFVKRPVVTEQKLSSLANQPVLAGKVTSYADLISGDYKLITVHAPDDTAAIDNNIKYMIKNELDEIELDGADALYTGYFYGFISFPEFGFSGCGVDTNRLFPENLYDFDEVATARADALAAATRVHDELWASGALKSTMSQKEKARVYYDWLIKNCRYGYASSYDGAMAYSALIEGVAVCQGYTAAYNLFLRLEGIDCSGVTSVVGNHGWTAATLDGVLYHIDVTWGDSTGNENKYFCMTPGAAWARFGGFEKELEFRKKLDSWYEEWNF